MFDRLRSLLSGPQKGEAPAAPALAPEAISAPGGGAAFAFAANLDPSKRFPILDWNAVEAWMAALPDGEHGAAWGACERAWLLHMRDAMPPGFRLEEGATAMVLSSLAPADARRALEFMERTLRRIVKVLDGVAVKPELGKDLLILFDEPEAYYEYASIYHPDGGEFALSSGMHITQGCGHYISLRHDLTSMEPVIAHEMTHGCLSHLPLPLWLNEGLAVNTEHRVTIAGNAVHTAADMRRRHLRFWGPDEVQQFWSGKSFRRQDDGNELSYDLARILVEQLSADWPRFASFARAANYQDGGVAAAREHLGLDLGDAAAALLEAPEPRAFLPDPSLWREPAEWIPQPA